MNNKLGLVLSLILDATLFVTFRTIRANSQALLYSSPQAINPPLPTRRFTVRGATEITVTDSRGNQQTTHADTIQERGWVPGIDILHLGENAYKVIMPSDGVYTIQFKASDKPVEAELLKGTTETTTQIVRYQNLNLPTNRTIMFSMSQDGAPLLQYDKDGDGQLDSPITPSVNVAGAAASDLIGPEVTMSSTVESGEEIVTIQAKDDSSGVRQIYYSTDGLHFKKYIEPLRFSRGKTTILQVVAKDNLGNQSHLYEYTVGAPPRQQIFLPNIRK